MEKAARFVNEQETKRGLGQAPTIAEYLPKIEPKQDKPKPPRRRSTK
jgi:ribosomal protein S30